jgi:hypothetical protein
MVLGELLDHALDAFVREQDSRAEARRRLGRVAVVLDLMHPAGAVRHLVRAGRYAGRDVPVGTRWHGCQRGRRLRAGKYRLHATGVTARGLPLIELTQPAAVSLLAFTRMYSLP